jgi:hypothetical protein
MIFARTTSRIFGAYSPFIASPFILAVPLIRHKRHMQDGEIRSLNALMK